MAATSPRTPIDAPVSRRTHVVRHSGIDEQGIQVGEQPLDAEAIAIGNERRIRRMQRNPRSRRLTQPTSEFVVVGVNVGDENRSDIPRCVPGTRHAGQQGGPKPPRCSIPCR